MMRRMTLGLLAGMLALGLPQPTPASGQTTATDVSKKTAEAWEALKDYTVEKKKDAVAYGQKLVKESDGKIKELEGKASTASGDLKAQYDKGIKDLKAKRAHATRKLDEMGKASASAWEDAKQGFADAYRELYQAYGKIVAQFK
ncbi:MAG: hypothetical protein ACREKS_16505 [Candidatus Rokuibacteriota bacterium]